MFHMYSSTSSVTWRFAVCRVPLLPECDGERIGQKRAEQGRRRGLAVQQRWYLLLWVRINVRAIQEDLQWTSRVHISDQTKTPWAWHIPVLAFSGKYPLSCNALKVYNLIQPQIYFCQHTKTWCKCCQTRKWSYHQPSRSAGHSDTTSPKLCFPFLQTLTRDKLLLNILKDNSK